MNRHPIRSTLLSTLLLALGFTLAGTAGAEQAQKNAPLPQPKVLMKVNGLPVTDIDILAFNALQGGRPATTRDAQVKLLNKLINTAILAQQGKKEGVDQLPNVKAALEMARLQVLAEAHVDQYLTKHPVTDEEIQQAYKKKYSGENLNEYQVRHILVKDEKEAQQVIDELKKGASFAELAKSHSVDSSKENGGKLGWVSRDQVVKPFGDAMVKLGKGQYTTEPVKSAFGWHVIQVDAIRKRKAPPLEEVKAQLKAQLRGQKLAEHILALRKQAKIDVVGETDKAAPAK